MEELLTRGCGVAKAEDGLSLPAEAVARSVQGENPLDDSAARLPVSGHEEIECRL